MYSDYWTNITTTIQNKEGTSESVFYHRSLYISLPKACIGIKPLLFKNMHLLSSNEYSFLIAIFCDNNTLVSILLKVSQYRLVGSSITTQIIKVSVYNPLFNTLTNQLFSIIIIKHHCCILYLVSETSCPVAATRRLFMHLTMDDIVIFCAVI